MTRSSLVFVIVFTFSRKQTKALPPSKSHRALRCNVEGRGICLFLSRPWVLLNDKGSHWKFSGSDHNCLRRNAYREFPQKGYHQCHQIHSPLNQNFCLLSTVTTLRQVSPSLACIIALYTYIYNLLFIYFWLCWVIVAVWIFSLVAATEDYSSLPHMGFLMWKLVVEHIFQGTLASVAEACGLNSCSSWALGHRLNSCGTQAQLLLSMWDFPRPGIEPMSLPLAGGFVTTESPGKPLGYFKS